VTINVLRNGVVRVEEKEESLYAAIDLVCDKVTWHICWGGTQMCDILFDNLNLCLSHGHKLHPCRCSAS